MAWHTLAGNKSNASPGLVGFVDCETGADTNYPHRDDAALHTLRLGCASLGRLEGGKLSRRQSWTFRQPAGFWNVLLAALNKQRPLWLFAHNAGFDVTVLELWGMVDTGAFRFVPHSAREAERIKGERRDKKKDGFVVLESPPTIIALEHERGGKLIVVDTLNYFRCSLAELGKGIGLDKLPMPGPWDDDAAWDTYCRRDVDIIETAMLGLIRWTAEQSLGRFRYTAAGQSDAAFRHGRMGHAIKCHDQWDVKDLERRAYCGGQHELYYHGRIDGMGRIHDSPADNGESLVYATPGGTTYLLDCSGMYPHVMRAEHYPWKLVTWGMLEYGEWTDPKDLADGGIAEVEIDTIERTYPLRTQAGTVFPIGRYRTVLAGPELEYAVAHGHVRSMGSWAKYRLTDLFSRFVTELTDLRATYQRDGNKLYDGLCKMLATNLHGKFGQWGGGWEFLPNAIPRDRWATWTRTDADAKIVVRYRSLAGEVQRETRQREKLESSVAISAFVTSHGREMMRKVRDLAGHHNYYYQCTDSLMVNAAGLANLTAAGLMGDGELGKFRVVAAGESAELRGLNNYRVGALEVVAGVGEDATQDNDGAYHFDAFQSLPSIIDGKPLPGVYVFRRAVAMQSVYDRGFVGPDGWVSPVPISMLPARYFDSPSRTLPQDAGTLRAAPAEPLPPPSPPLLSPHPWSLTGEQPPRRRRKSRRE